MIFYGWKPVVIGTQLVKNYKCSSCDEVDTTYLSIYSTHFHIFWIPVFPFNKKSISVCGNCDFEYSKKDMPNNISSAQEMMSMNTKIPKWQFSGLAIIGAVILWSMYGSSEDKKENFALVHSPEVGDVYEYKEEEEEHKYSIMRIYEISEDSLWFQLNNYEVDKRNSTDELNVDSCFSDYYIQHSKEKIDSMLHDGTIMDVLRTK